MIAQGANSRTERGRLDDEWLLVRLAAEARSTAGYPSSAMKDPIAGAMLASIEGAPHAPARDWIAVAAQRAAVDESEVSRRIGEHFAHEVPWIGDARADLLALASRMAADDEEACAILEYRDAIDGELDGDAPRNPGRVAMAAQRVAEIRSRGGPGRTRTLADDWIDPAAAPPERVATGLRWWDDALDGGMLRGTVVALVAAPKCGKSTLALQLALAHLRRHDGATAVYYSGEMSPRTLQVRALSHLAGLSPILLQRDPAHLSREQRDARQRGLELFGAVAPRLTLLTGSEGPRSIFRAATESGAKLAVVDYLQLLSCGTSERDSRRERLEQVVRDLCQGAAHHEVSVLAISSSPKESVRSGADPDIAGCFRETGAAGYDVDAVFLGAEDRELTRAMGDGAVVATRWRCLGNRHGEPRDLSLVLHRPTLTFRPLEASR